MKFELGQELNTFTIIGWCPTTYQLGVCLATYSLAVGGYCPSIKTHVGALSTQAFANPQLGPVAMRLLEMGFSPEKVLRELEEHDQYIEYRQVGIIDRNGVAACKTGSLAPTWAGHIVGEGFVAMGNRLAGEHVVEAMADSFTNTGNKELQERLVSAVEAGRDAGGQPQGQRSAALILHGREDYPLMDLRVDSHDSPEQELRRLFEEYIPYVPYYIQRHYEPWAILPQDEFKRKLEEQR